MVAPQSFLAVDWGASNLRAWVVGGDGAVLAEAEHPWGISRLKPGEAIQRLNHDLRPALGAEALPAVLCGTVGSALGIAMVPYLDCPAGPAEVAAALHRVKAPGAPIFIIPGLRCTGPDGAPDVMRSEETQVFGWIAQVPARRGGAHLVCLPGTHSKWVRVEDGRVQTFATAMTGELFDLLSRRSLMRTPPSPHDAQAFAQGLTRAEEPGPLATRMFTARARLVTADLPEAAVRSYLSGVLVGDEVANPPAFAGDLIGGGVDLIGDPALCGLYAEALSRRGVAARLHDGAATALAGLRLLHSMGRLT